MLRPIRTSGDALLAVINDILDFSKIESDRLQLEQQPFQLVTCIDETLDLFAGKAVAQEIELTAWIDDNVPAWLIGDMPRLRQILVNLIGNGVKFTRGGEVENHGDHRRPLLPACGCIWLCMTPASASQPIAWIASFNPFHRLILRQHDVSTGPGWAWSSANDWRN
jgi:hypothetical protein